MPYNLHIREEALQERLRGERHGPLYDVSGGGGERKVYKVLKALK